MKADGARPPAAEPWSRTTATHLDLPGWDPCEKMSEPTPDPRLLETQLDFFHKLGFSTAQVRAVQQKFGIDTDKVLGELVRIGAGREAKRGPVTTVSVLVPRGDPRAGDPRAGDPRAGDHRAGDHRAGDHRAGDHRAGDPRAGDHRAGDHRAGDSRAGDHRAGDSRAGDPRAGDHRAGDPRAGDHRARGPELLVPVPDWSPRSREDNGEDGDALRAVVIDGSNVAMSHGNKEVFSCLGIQLAVNFFLERGHSDVTVFVPSWRKEQPRPDVPITDQHILRELERKKILVFTPSRRVAGKRVVCNDDCFIVKHAFESDGVVVSNDMYRDLQGEKPEWKRFIEERLLMYSFVNNKFMPPDDPLGRHGPNLENFLRKFPRAPKKQACPYGKKCTYGIKCKFLHPERSKQSNRTVADDLRQNAKNLLAAHKPGPTHCGPVPDRSLCLVEEMAKKLTLGHDGASLNKQEHPAPVKGSHRSGKKSQTRKEKTGQHSDRGSVWDHGSQEQLDSGLGSIDSQQVENMWSLHDQRYGASYGTVPHRFCPPGRAACSCSSHGPFQPARMVPVSSHSAPYSPPRYPSCGPVPRSRAAFSQPPDFQDRRVQTHQHPSYWSDPFGGRLPEVAGPLGERSPWETVPSPEQKEVVRKKLLAIFSAQLVDTAMDLFPQVLDPQVLVAEILILQSQNQSLR